MQDEMNGYRCLVVVGAQWGDEGKGKIVDVLAPEVDIVARYQGGANAGHTVRVGGEEFILHQIPSGILHPGTRCLLGNGVVLDVEQFFRELDALHARRVDTDARGGVGGRAHLLLEYHKRLDLAGERLRGPARIGTTGKGIGPAYEDKIARRGIRVADLRREDAGEMVRAAAERANEALRAAGAEPLDPGRIAEDVLAVRERLLGGARGARPDVDHGTDPCGTSSTTTAAGAATGVGIGPTSIDAVLGVVKAYTTRVGGGPLPTELDSEIGDRLRDLGGEYGA